MVKATQNFTIEGIIEKVRAFLLEQGYEGFVTEENPHANPIEVSEIQSFIADLQNEGILDGSLADVYVQYTVDNNEGSYENMGTKFIAFNGEKLVGFVPFNKVIEKRDWNYQGLSEDGFRRLLNIMVG